MKSTRLKDLINNKDTSISFQEYRLRYATERFLMRVKESQFKDNLILKGGFLLGIIYEIEQRTTKDLDTLLMGMTADRIHVEDMLTEIISIELKDDVTFEVANLSKSENNRIYDGFRAKLKMKFTGENTYVQFDLDLGVGDSVIPNPQIKEIPLIFNEANSKEESISLYSYPLETILSEKTETILMRGTTNSRMKDFYDIHLILNDPDKPNIYELYEAFCNTWTMRHKDTPINEEQFEDWFFIIDELSENQQIINIYWEKYIKNREYMKEIKFVNIINQFHNYVEALQSVFREKNRQ